MGSIPPLTRHSAARDATLLTCMTNGWSYKAFSSLGLYLSTNVFCGDLFSNLVKTNGRGLITLPVSLAT